MQRRNNKHGFGRDACFNWILILWPQTLQNMFGIYCHTWLSVRSPLPSLPIKASWAWTLDRMCDFLFVVQTAAVWSFDWPPVARTASWKYGFCPSVKEQVGHHPCSRERGERRAADCFNLHISPQNRKNFISVGNKSAADWLINNGSLEDTVLEYSSRGQCECVD